MSTYTQRFNQWARNFDWRTIKWSINHMPEINFVKIFSSLPEPQKRTAEDWRKIDRFWRNYNKLHDIVNKTRYAEQYLRHLEENFMFDPDERFY